MQLQAGRAIAHESLQLKALTTPSEVTMQLGAKKEGFVMGRGLAVNEQRKMKHLKSSNGFFSESEDVGCTGCPE